MHCVLDRLAFRLGVLVSCFAAAAIGVNAVEIGHFTPGVPSIRDLVMPEPGFYGVLYNYGYTTDRLNDSGGNEINSVTINPCPGGGVTREVTANVDVYAISPVLIWVSPWKPLGAKYGAYIAPTFGNTSIAGALSSQTGAGRSAEESNFGPGDMFVQPLGWIGRSSIGISLSVMVFTHQSERMTRRRSRWRCSASERSRRRTIWGWAFGRIKFRAPCRTIHGRTNGWLSPLR